jgi:F-type H+-transporting ATPase subunit b|tara:strand:- start:336 stop:866 length:531 start_codon:yes stop_codon:yes gene_type:complete
MIYQKEVEINIMEIDSTFWVAVSFVIFFGGLIYLKIPQKINEILNKLILDIKNEIDESERLRTEAKTLLDNAQNKLDKAESVKNEIIDQAKKDSDRLIISLNDKFHKSSDLKKNLAENKINQIKENAIKEIKNASIKIAVDSAKKIITTSIDKSKLDTLFQKNLDETKEELKKINS